MNGDDERGLIWRLPVVKTNDLGKLGPGFAVGAGCGLGFGVGLIGGVAMGPGIPGLQLGFGVGVVCGVGLGFGYGIGKGIAYDGSYRYSNVGNLFQKYRNVPSQDQIGAIVDEIVVSSKRLLELTSKELDKWKKSQW